MENTLYTREIITLEPNLDVAFLKVTPDILRPYIPFHWHDSYELIYLLSGTATFHKMSRPTLFCLPGDIICTEPYEIHDMVSSPDTTFIMTMIPTIFIQKYIPDLEHIHFRIPTGKVSCREHTKINYLQKTFYDMLVADTFKEKGYLLRFQSLLFELMYQLYHNFSVNEKEEDTLKQSKDYHRLQTIVSYVHENYQGQISIEKIAGQVHLQPQYFCHYFKQNFGQSFLNYVYEVRLFNIEADLIQTDLPIGFIAEKHGFNSLDLFRKKFFQKNQCTPAVFRKNMKGRDKAAFPTHADLIP